MVLTALAAGAVPDDDAVSISAGRVKKGLLPELGNRIRTGVGDSGKGGWGTEGVNYIKLSITPFFIFIF
jgi:hypothetical protein